MVKGMMNIHSGMNAHTGRPTVRKPTQFGLVILGALSKLGHTQSWISQEGKVSHTCVSKWIYKPDTAIKPDNVAMLARILDIPLAKLNSARGSANKNYRRATDNKGSKMDSTVEPARRDGGSPGNLVIRSLLPQLSDQQRLQVLEMIFERAYLSPTDSRKVIDHIVALLIPGGDDTQNMNA